MSGRGVLLANASVVVTMDEARREIHDGTLATVELTVHVERHNRLAAELLGA